jgi:hypothetical protein
LHLSQNHRAKRSARLFDAYGDNLLAMADTLTGTRSRADRLVVDTIAGQGRRRSAWARRRHERHDMSGSLHGRWLSTHAPRGPRHSDDTSIRSRLHDLTDLQLGLVALCLFGGYTYVRAGHLLSLTPAESAGHLRDALMAVGGLVGPFD